MQIASAPSSSWNYDFTNCRPGTKMLLLLRTGVAHIGTWPGRGDPARAAYYIAWSPLPDRDMEKEKALGIRGW